MSLARCSAFLTLAACFALTAAAPDRRYVPPTVRGNAAVRGIVLVLGLLVFAAGIAILNSCARHAK